MKLLVSTPLFYINSEIHIGHEYSIFYASYIAKILLNDGHQVVFLTGTDENGTKANLQLKDQLQRLIFDVVRAMYGEPFVFYATGSVQHYQFVRGLLPILMENSHISTFKGFYKNEEFIASDDGEEEETLKLDLTSYWKSTNILYGSTFTRELYDIGNNFHRIIDISRRNSIGIKINNRLGSLYVWIDALMSYLHVADRYGTDRSIHVCGKDILRFHSYYLGSMCSMLKYSNPYVIPHGWVLNDGRKISKSLNNTYNFNITNDLKKFIFMSFMGPNDFSLNEQTVQQYHHTFYRRYMNIISRAIGILNSNTCIKIFPKLIIRTLNPKKQMRYFNMASNYYLHHITGDTFYALQGFVNLLYSFSVFFEDIGMQLMLLINNNNTVSVGDLKLLKEYVISIL